ncbi:hypothetical protein MBLNU459_g8450t2 [Dothideomycetes sp. NU459]
MSYPQQKQWRAYLTLDTVVSLLWLPLPVAWSLPLISLAYNPTWNSTPLISTAIFASALTLLSALAALNSRVAYGVPRKLDWAEEVVVITGGASGLGRLIAEIFGMRGASVAVLDVKEFEGSEEMGEGFRWYKCNVGNLEAVQDARKAIVKDFYYNGSVGWLHANFVTFAQLGTPTIIINNAGIVNGRPMLSLQPSAIEQNFRINLLSHYHSIQTFLPAMLDRPSGGTVVTVASVLGHLGASHLSDYTAAKAGLIAMHASLRAELASMLSLQDSPRGAKNIRTVLVKPGQLSTQMFGSVQTPSSFFGPVVEAIDLANAIVKMVDSGKSGVIAMPLYAQYIEWLGVLPVGLQRIVRVLSGVDDAMDGFTRPGSVEPRHAT